MGSIVLSAGKFLILRTDKTTGEIPYVSIKGPLDGGACIISDKTGKIWIFYQNAAKLSYVRSTDTIGTVWGTPVDIVATLVSDGIPGAVETSTGQISVFFWKTDDKFYQAKTLDYGVIFTVSEVTSA